MTVLLLRLAGPLQAWGSDARFTRRGTENAPTKSGVLGLLAAAEGRTRSADLSDLAALRYGVRIDQPGTRVRDFHTAHHADTGRSMPLSERYYLADAVFVAGVEGEAALIRRLHEAMRAPRFLPYLGRRSCPPSRPLLMGEPLLEQSLEEALAHTPWQGSRWYERQLRRSGFPTSEHAAPEPLDLLIDCPPHEAPDFSLRDSPVSFAPGHRQYELRGIRTSHATTPVHKPTRQAVPVHDPTAVLRAANSLSRPGTAPDAR
ncbi:type I-E CRISPR-associated protein Cas5/CasD [Streptomyces sp. NPDC059479]|uniref:type I-E CRISPR-associated protein Cas5/CasD n=1 Tax=Streptomyces sp. NPDC059479 TaxID=3346848 RepID=UPI00369F9980